MGTVAGIDEAGRGCIIGPLVVAGLSLEEKEEEKLSSIGVRDSKLLSPSRREALAPQILEIAGKYSYFELSPRSIDAVVIRKQRLRSLNYLEAMAMAKIIRDLEPDVVYLDPSDVLPERFSDQILRVLKKKIKIVSEHNADERYPVVSAASILAKVRRDRLVSELRERYGNFGSGYCHDERTITFLTNLIRSGSTLPEIVRRSWKTLKNIEGFCDSSP